MEKVIKEFKNEDLIYELGYILYKNKIQPRIEIYKNNKLFSGGHWEYGYYAGLFYFFTHCSFSYVDSHFGTIKEMFTELRKYHKIPEEVEKEYENMFLLYKLNDFNKF